MEQHSAHGGRPAGGAPPRVRAFAEVNPGLASGAAPPPLVSIHLRPPVARAPVLRALDDDEHELLSRVCCACCSLADAAREMGLSHREALRMWHAVAHRLR